MGSKGSSVGGIDDEDEDEEIMRSLDTNYAWDQIRESQVFLEPPIKTIPPSISSPEEETTASTEASKKDFVRFVFISDTHGRHRDVPYLPKGDILVHAGDFTNVGETGTIEDLGLYFREHVRDQKPQPPSGTVPTQAVPSFSCPAFRNVVCVAGNHDVSLDQDFYDRNNLRLHRKDYKFDPTTAESVIRRDSVYLRDEFHLLEFPIDPTTADTDKNANSNVHIWGSPYTPEFYDWAFNKKRGSPIREIWDKIPSKDGDSSNDSNRHPKRQKHYEKHHQPVDILITHGPPLGRGDLVILNRATKSRNANTTRAGCYDLLRAIQDRVKPRINVFGHIHEGYGVTYDGTTLYVNASTMNVNYEAIHLPIVVDLPLAVSGYSSTSASPSVVKPSSLFRNLGTDITSVEEWIKWCRHHGHEFVANALQERFPATNKWFGGELEPPPDMFFETLADILGYCRRNREARRKLAKMVFHMYAESFSKEIE